MADKRPWFKFWPGDWLSDPNVTGMTPAERGAYMQLLAASWLRTPRATLPQGDAELCRLAGCTPDEWHLVKHKVLERFELRDGVLVNPRLAREAELADAAVESGRRAASVRWGDMREGMRNGCGTHAEGHAESMRNGMRNACEKDGKSEVRSQNSERLTDQSGSRLVLTLTDDLPEDDRTAAVVLAKRIHEATFSKKRKRHLISQKDAAAIIRDHGLRADYKPILARMAELEEAGTTITNHAGYLRRCLENEE